MGTFGNTNEEADGRGGENYIHGCKFTCPEDCTVDSISVFVKVTTASKLRKCAIYDVNKGFVAETEERTLGVEADFRWETFDFASPPSLNGGDEYYLCSWGESGGGVNNLKSGTGATDQSFYQSITYDSWPATCAGTDWDVVLSIYCTYTPVVVGAMGAAVGDPLII